RPAPGAGELVAVQLGHRVVDIEQYLAAEQPRPERAQHRRVGHRAYDHDVVWSRPGAARRDRRGAAEKVQVTAEVAAAARTAVARDGDLDHVDALESGRRAAAKADHVDFVAALGERFGVTA